MTIIFLVVGLVFAALGVFLIIDHKNFLKTARKANGNVIAVEKYISTTSTNSRSEKRTYYRPIIDYVANGDSYRLTASIGNSDIKYDIGQRVPVLFSPNNPKDAKMDTPMQYMLGGIFTFLGLAGVIVFIFDHLESGFVWWEPLLALLVVGVLANIVRKSMKMAGVSSISEIKSEIKKQKAEHGNAVIVGSEGDPLLDKKRTFYSNRKDFMAEKSKLEFAKVIISLIFMIAGFVMLYFGWDIYLEESSRAEPAMVKQYALLGMGALFVFSSLHSFLRSKSSSVSRM